MIKGFGSPVYQVLQEIQVRIVTETTGKMELEFKDFLDQFPGLLSTTAFGIMDPEPKNN